MVAKFIIKFSIPVRNWLAKRLYYAAYQSSDCGFDSVSNLCPEVLCTLRSIYNCLVLKGKMLVWLPEKFSIFNFAKETVILSTPVMMLQGAHHPLSSESVASNLTEHRAV